MPYLDEPVLAVEDVHERSELALQRLQPQPVGRELQNE